LIVAFGAAGSSSVIVSGRRRAGADERVGRAQRQRDLSVGVVELVVGDRPPRKSWTVSPGPKVTRRHVAGREVDRRGPIQRAAAGERIVAGPPFSACVKPAAPNATVAAGTIASARSGAGAAPTTVAAPVVRF
jgi:hypothetical protein